VKHYTLDIPESLFEVKTAMSESVCNNVTVIMFSILNEQYAHIQAACYSGSHIRVHSSIKRAFPLDAESHIILIWAFSCL